MSVLQKFIASISWNILGKVGIQLVYFVLSILITRYLGRESLGIYATLLVIPAFVRLLNSCGLEMALHRCLPRLQVQDPTLSEGRYLLRRTMAFRLATTILAGLLLYLALPTYALWIDQPHLLDYRAALGLYFGVVAMNSLLGAVFMTYLDYKTVTLGEGLNAVINLVLLVVFVQMDRGISGVLYAYILASAVNLIYYGMRLGPLAWGETRPTPLRPVAGLAWTLYLVSLLSFGLMTQTDVLLMNFFRVDAVHVGYYHLATSLGGMLTFILMGLGPLALSLFSDTYAREGESGLSRAWLMIAGFAIFVSAPIYVFAGYQAEALIQFIYGDAFAVVGGLFALYILFLAAQLMLGSELNSWALVTLDRQNRVLRICVEGSVINVLLDALLIPFYGEWGAVTATGSVMVYMALRQLRALRSAVTVAPLMTLGGKYFLFALVALLPCLAAVRLGMRHVLALAGIYGLMFLLQLLWVRPLPREHLGLMSELYPRWAPCLRWFSK